MTARGEDSAVDYGLLPRDRSFAQSLPAFLLPYAAYVALPSLYGHVLPPAAGNVLRFLVVAALLYHFRKRYRFGPALTLRTAAAALGASIVALALWVLCYRLALALPWWQPLMASASAARPDGNIWPTRLINSVLLVPVFEELLCRAWAGELLHGMPSAPGGLSARLGSRMDDHPTALSAPPLSRAAVIGCTLIFTIGHPLSAWPAAIAYFLFTSWFYRKTGSFLACILVHALVNLGVALLVRMGPEMRFLWY